MEAACVDPVNAMAIDIGVDNLASCITTLGTSFILDGRKLKSINQGWNKEKARLQSVADKQGAKRTDKMSRITEKRNNQAKDIMRKSARYIINHCIEHHIGTVIVGYTPDFKRNINIRRKNNQAFVNISFGDFRQLLSGLCERYGIQYIEQEESYTSKSSFLDGDILPEYKPEQPYTGTFSGRRIHRGLYKTKDGTVVNADMNGAANILRKSKQNFDFEGLCRGLLASPQRIRLA
ncbi:MAG: transposase [Erysipelotrichaceae bacterium]|nr:transposase [Erysipelotrichaceae bacterium]